MSKNPTIKIIQARISTDMFNEIRTTIRDINNKRSQNQNEIEDQKKVKLQNVIVEALNDWLLKQNQFLEKKDPFFQMRGIVNTKISKNSE